MRSILRGLLMVTTLCIVISMAWGESIPIEDYLPEIRYGAGQTEFPIGMTALPEFFGLGRFVEENWELYEPGDRFYPQDLSVSVHVTDDWDPAFACDFNPLGKFHVIQYHYYYARNDHWLDTADHEHDWEWIYVVVFNNESCGHIPYAVSLSSHDEDNHDSEVYFYPWVSHGPYIDVEDGTHPVAYLVDGNAFSNTGSGSDSIDWEEFLSTYTMEDGSLAYSSCDGDEVVYNESLAYGIDGYFECKDIRRPPWLRIHWDNSFAIGQFSIDGLDDEPEPCLPLCDDWCCSPGCSWGLLRYCEQQPYFSFGRNPRAWSRPSNVITTSEGHRLFWEDWDHQGSDFAVLRKTVGETGWDTIAVVADSTYTDLISFDGEMGQYKILSRTAAGSPSRITPKPAEVFIEAEFVLPLDRPIVQMTRCGHWIFGVSTDGFLHRFNETDGGSIELAASHDLRDWGFYQGSNDSPQHIAAGLVYFGHRDADYWSSYVLLLAIPQKGVAVILIDRLTGSPDFQSLGPPEAHDIAILEDRVYTAQADGLGFWRIEEPSHMPVALIQCTEPVVPAGMLPYCRSVHSGPGYTRVSAVFDAPDEGSDGVYLYDGLFYDELHAVGSLQGCPSSASCENLPMEWKIEDIDADQGLMILRSVAGHHTYTLADVSSPQHPSYLGTWKNDLFSNLSRVGWWNGTTAVLLPGGYQLRAGEAGVFYGGLENMRFWGGLEMYKSPLPDDPYGFEYQTTVADEGYKSLEQMDLVPTGLLSWPDPEGTLILASYYDPWEDTEDSGRLVLYRAAADLPITRVEDDEVPSIPEAKTILRFGRPFPNPARNGVEFLIDLPQPANLTLRVIDPAGRSVCVPARGVFTRGRHRFHWDGRNNGGRKVAPGVYFVTVELEGRLAGVRRAVLIR